MASPQPDKYTRLSNELLREIYRFPFSGSQLRVVFMVVRFSYGWARKKTEQMGYRTMSKETNMPRSSIQLALTLLVEMNVLERDDHGRWGIKKDYEKWVAVGQPTVPGGPAHRTGGASGLAERGQPTVPGGASGLTAYKEKEKRKERKKEYCAENPAPNKLIPQQIVIRYFKEAKGVNADDKDWDRKHWNGRLMKEAAALLKAFDGDPINAGRYMLITSEEWSELPDWTMNAVAAKAGRDKTLHGAGEENGSKNGEMVADRVDGPGRRPRLTSSRDLAGDALAELKQQAAVSSRGAGELAGPPDDRFDDKPFEP